MSGYLDLIFLLFESTSDKDKKAASDSEDKVEIYGPMIRKL